MAPDCILNFMLKFILPTCIWYQQLVSEKKTFKFSIRHISKTCPCTESINFVILVLSRDENSF